jgi:hypothetical protein
VIHARDDDVRAARQQPRLGVERHVHAICRGAVDGERALFVLKQPKWAMQAERVTRRALLRLGCAHDDFGDGLERAR